MKDKPRAIRREAVNASETRVESTCRSGPSSFVDKVECGGGHLVEEAVVGKMRVSAGRFPENVGAIA